MDDRGADRWIEIVVRVGNFYVIRKGRRYWWGREFGTTGDPQQGNEQLVFTPLTHEILRKMDALTDKYPALFSEVYTLLDHLPVYVWNALASEANEEGQSQ